MENPNPPLRIGSLDRNAGRSDFQSNDTKRSIRVSVASTLSGEEDSHSHSTSKISSTSLTSTNSTIPGESLQEKYSVADRLSIVLVTFSLQDFYKSHLRHYHVLQNAIRQRFGQLVDVRRIEGQTNAGFDVYIGITFSSKSERLIFSRIIEGVFPQVDAVLGVIERAIADRKVEERDLSKVQCCFIYSDQEHSGIFKRLVNQATSQLIGRIKFEIQMVPVKDVLEVWVNGQLIYSWWYCGQAPVLHDIIMELQKASLGQPFDTMPRLRS